MTLRFMVATRKGLFLAERGHRRWKVSHSAFLGSPATMLLPDPRDRTWYAALNLGHFGVKLHRSEDGGKSWEEVASPVFPERPEDSDDKVPWSVLQIWAMEAGGEDEPGVIWAGVIPGGLFRSEDRGRSWALIRPLWDRPERRKWLGGGYDHPGIHSICVDPRDSGRVTIAVSCGGLWRTGDRGRTWELIGKGLRADYVPPEQKDDLTIQDPHRMVACRADPELMWIQHHNGIFRSGDGGRHWSGVGVEPSSFGFTVCVHPEEGRTAWFVPAQKDELRIPVKGRLVVTRTRDGGESFQVLSKGLPARNAWDLVYRHSMDISGDGRCLMMGSTTGSLWVTEDGGDSWKNLSNHLPPVYCVRFLP